MKTLYQAFKTDTNLEVQGVTLDFGVAKFKVRRAGGSNRAYATVFSNKSKPHIRKINTGTLDEDTGLQILLDTYFEAVVLGWEGVTDENGEPLEYNRENFHKVMRDLPDLWMTIRTECDNMRNFQHEEAKVDGESLGKS